MTSTKTTALYVLMFLLSATLSTKAQTSLYPGDLTIISVNSDGNKSFAVLFLRDVQAGTTCHFTDNAWISATHSFRDSEGVLSYTAPSDIAKGQVVVCPSKDGGNGFVESGSFNPAGSGDNIIVFQGTLDDPFFIYGIGWARGASVWEYSEVSASYRSDVPEGLSFDNNTVVSLGTKDNYVYVGTRYLELGTRGGLLLELADDEMFSSSNSDELTWGNGSFLVGGDVQESLSSGLWSETSWTTGVPSRFSDVEINGIVQLDVDAVVHDLTVMSGARLEVLPGASLTVMGKLANNNGVSGIIILSDENGSGALFSTTENVNGTVEIYLTANQWHFVSSPVTTSQTIQEIFGTPDSHLYGVYKYNEPTGTWIPNTENLVPSTCSGFNVLYQGSPKKIAFVGALNSFRFRRFITLSRGAGGGWNLIGNPFPAPMNWSGNIKKANLEHETIYVTTGGSGNDTSWDTFNAFSGVGVPSNDVGNVAVGQGFWVKSEVGGELGFGCYGKTRASSNFKRGALSNILPVTWAPHQVRGDNRASVVRLALFDDGGRSDQVAVWFDEKATEGFDEFDSESFDFGRKVEEAKGQKDSGDFGIAFPIDDKYCIIASYPKDFSTGACPENREPFDPSTNKITIPINILPSQGLQSLRMLRGLEQFASIILEDRFLGIVHNLSIQPVYEFHAGSGFLGGTGRFFLHFTFQDVQDALCSVDGQRVEGAKGLKVGYYDLVGNRYSRLAGLKAGIYLHVFESDGELVSVKTYYNGY